MKKAAPPDVLKKLLVLGDKQGAIKLNDLAQEMGLGADETLVFLRQIFPIGVGIETYHKDGDCWIDIKGEAIQYMLPLSPGEWIQLHQILSGDQTSESLAFSTLKKKVTEDGPIKVVMELLSQLELWDEELNDFQQQLIKKIEVAIENKHLVNLTTNEDKKYAIYPCKILHLEGHLSLIAEDSQDHCLLVIPLQKLKVLETVSTTGQSRVSPFEVDEFISAIRAMNENETRLILKIHNAQSFSLFPDHHFLGKPCMITNPNGDLIWAAYVEPCEALYEWLMTLGKNVEILDPIRFKEKYLTYCEEKLRKVA
jgi:predicted DNA-binding transcriptional regulator YafY